MQVRTKMTDLDRGLVISGRRNGLTVDQLCEVFHRDHTTIRRILKKAKARHQLPSLKEIRAKQKLIGRRQP